ncbi:MAG: TM2 domain-containing protein [Candidatus Parcubacteria bacterium]|jgi:TM2 domain-containing membrane protein YozV
MKKKTPAALLALFLGGFGIHKFYLGKTTPGVFYLLFCWTFIPAILAFIDFIIILSTNKEAFNKKYNV